MSDTFDYMEFLKPKLERQKKAWELPLLNLTTFQPKVEENDVLNTTISRHLSQYSYVPPVIIRKVRNVTPSALAALPQPIARRVIPPAGVMVNRIRPYSGKTRTSCYWQDSGWEKRDNYLIGRYKAGRRSFPGSIELSNSVVEPFSFYIYDPPSAILDGPHGACFMHMTRVDGRDRYFVHFSEDPPDIDSGIIQIQRDLSEAIGA